LGISLVSCEFILKEPKDDSEVKPEAKVSLGTDKDENGCVTSAGYKWSAIRKECIRVFDEGYRLNNISQLKEEGTRFSAFVIFSVDNNKAEIFLPESPKSITLT